MNPWPRVPQWQHTSYEHGVTFKPGTWHWQMLSAERGPGSVFTFSACVGRGHICGSVLTRVDSCSPPGQLGHGCLTAQRSPSCTPCQAAPNLFFSSVLCCHHTLAK